MTFDEAFAPLRDAAERDYLKRTYAAIDKLRDEFGTIRWPGFGRNGFSRHRLACRYLRTVGLDRSARLGTEMRVATEVLAKEAEAFAHEQHASFVAKMERKLPGAVVASVAPLGGGRYIAKGQIGRFEFAVEQSAVFKMSSRDVPYMQWPARIYIDGRFMSEKAVRELLAS